MRLSGGGRGGGWGEENWSPSLRSGGSLFGEQDVQEAGDGPEFGPLCRACGTRDPGRSVSSWIH